MRLVIDECSHCDNCVETCPVKANFECRQCIDPACAKACPRGAFYESTAGVWSIDAGKCDGCSLCASACPYNAIYIDGYARKCDLCQGQPKCAERCPKGLRLEQTLEEVEGTRRILGWAKAPGAYATGLYMPSYQEARVLEAVVGVFRELAKEKELDIAEVLEQYCEQAKLVLGEEQRNGLLKLLEYETRGFSILEPMLADDSLEEVTVNGLEQPIRVYRRGGGWEEADAAFLSEKKAIDVINRIARPLGRRITLQKPRLNACLPNGSRLHAAIPPVVDAPCLTIRKFRQSPMTPRELIDNGTISDEALAFLWMAMQCDLNIIVAGSTGSGKTTTLNCLSAFIPLNERIIIVEETPEMSIPHEHTVRLTVNQELGLTMGELVNDTLRMRPDRVVVGEVRTADEAKALLNTMLAGQGKGSLATFHALNSREAVSRLRTLGISEQDLTALDLIVVQKRWDSYDAGTKRSRELRRVMEISEVDVRDGKATPKALFEYDAAGDRLRRAGEGRVAARIRAAFALDAKGFRGEWARRQKTLASSSLIFNNSVGEVNEAIFGKAGEGA